ncbi:Casein kinase II regulatory subunit [Penicillium macrosclerotiorum]|uniref:Casein kinase II regulatory subunit n=1 Tax=Penicillium macrosclerotiorum TaxID=303699 RepID=UPI0025474E75|nr:Casein kinase II regulatory subunit [Penicillium macrosclerotiorum]KAJ5683370.1 Casein kinase II regulatory subunit [Penicillium macrosclerotiorum]
MTESSDREIAPLSSQKARKRAKYTQIACIECKRRKLKCSGGAVCTRCARGEIRCIYPTDRTPIEETEFKDARVGIRFEAVDRQLESLRREMRTMHARLREFESSGSPVGANVPKTSTAWELDRILNAPKSPQYVGPTSAEFGLHASQKRPSQIVDHDEEEGDDIESVASARSPLSKRKEKPCAEDRFDLGLQDALRLLQVYEDNVGVMYPCVDLESVRAYVHEYYRSHASILIESSELSTQTPSDQDWFFARDIQVLKIILAIALVAESHGRSECAAQLANSVEDIFASRFKVAEVDMKEILIMTLLSIFHSYRDDEVISWRLTRIATSACMELGLHRQETWQRTGGVFPGELAWTWAVRLYWCIYVLDRKWSFGSGLPFGIQDTDMDVNLPEPDQSSPYLTCMISYARLSTKIWGLIMEWPKRSRLATSDKCAQLDAQVQQWIWSIPRELRFDPSWQTGAAIELERSGHSDRIMMLQVLLALQGNQLRILVYRQNLVSAERIDEDVTGASIAVETAKRTIHMLEYFSQVTDIYFQRPEPFNYFLISALAALLLAVLHAPSRFSNVCRQEFYTATKLVRRSATRAPTSRRLQKIIRSLNQIQLHKNGVEDQSGGNQDRQAKRKRRSKTSPSRPVHLESEINPGSSHHSLVIAPESSSIPVQQPQPYEVQVPSTSWQFSPGAIMNPEENICQNLSSFFEVAGDLYFGSTAGTDFLAGDVDPNLSVPPDVLSSSAADMFEADNEALTRVMADLL